MECHARRVRLHLLLPPHHVFDSFARPPRALLWSVFSLSGSRLLYDALALISSRSPGPRAYIPPPPRPELGKDGRKRGPTPLWAHAVLLPEEAIPPLYDLPIEVVERVLYGSSDEDDDVEEGDEEGTDEGKAAEEIAS